MRGVLVVTNQRSRRGGRLAQRVRSWLDRREDAGADRSAADRSATDENGPVGFRDLATFTAETDPHAVPQRVVAVGGDGTHTAVLETLWRLELDPLVGIVPAGTGNNLATGLGLPLDTTAACAIAFESSASLRIDVFPYGAPGAAKRRLIVQSGSFGFPAEITARFDRLRQSRAFRVVARPLGTSIYKLLAFCGLAAQKRREARGEVLAVRCTFPRADGSELAIEENVIAVFVHNEPTIGGGFVPCPDARVDDGLADICVLRAGTGRSYLELFRLVGKGRHIEEKDTTIYESTPGPLRLEFSTATPFVADGDIHECLRNYEVDVVPRRFAIVVPASKDVHR